MLSIRTATPADVDAVVGVGRSTWPAAFRDMTSARYVQEGLARWWTYPAVLPAIEARQVLVAERENRVVGMAMFHSEIRATLLDRLYVLPAEQSRGVGSALLSSVVGQAPVQPVRLTVLADNRAAQRFYSRHGFVTVARAPHPQGGPARLTMQSFTPLPDERAS